MPKAKLSHMANTWLDEDRTPKEKRLNRWERDRENIEEPKKKQTFNLKIDTIKRLWGHRAMTSKTVSSTIDELVSEHLPKYPQDKQEEKKEK